MTITTIHQPECDLIGVVSNLKPMNIQSRNEFNHHVYQLFQNHDDNTMEDLVASIEELMEQYGLTYFQANSSVNGVPVAPENLRKDLDELDYQQHNVSRLAIVLNNHIRFDNATWAKK